MIRIETGWNYCKFIADTLDDLDVLTKFYNTIENTEKIDATFLNSEKTTDKFVVDLTIETYF